MKFDEIQRARVFRARLLEQAEFLEESAVRAAIAVAHFSEVAELFVGELDNDE